MTEPNIRPLHDHVIVRVLEGEERVSAGGIIYSANCEKTHKRAIVVRVGPGREDKRGRRTSMESVGVGAVVMIEDWRVKWHSGEGQWPVAGDLAMVPVDALACVVERAGATVDFTKIGVRT